MLAARELQEPRLRRLHLPIRLLGESEIVGDLFLDGLDQPAPGLFDLRLRRGPIARLLPKGDVVARLR